MSRIDRVLSGHRSLSRLEKEELHLRLRGGGGPLVKAEAFNDLVAGLTVAEPQDAYTVVRALAACTVTVRRNARPRDLRDVHPLEGLLRVTGWDDPPRRIHERMQCVVGGLEQDYMRRFTAPAERQVLRLAFMLRGLGRGLALAEGRSGEPGGRDDVLVAENLLATVEPDTASPEALTAVRLLVGQDIVSRALEGGAEDRAHAELHGLRLEWPHALAARLDDILLAGYLAEASACTAFRVYKSALSSAPMTAAPRSKPPLLTGRLKPAPAGALTLAARTDRERVQKLLVGLEHLASLVA